MPITSSYLRQGPEVNTLRPVKGCRPVATCRLSDCFVVDDDLEGDQVREKVKFHSQSRMTQKINMSQPPTIQSQSNDEEQERYHITNTTNTTLVVGLIQLQCTAGNP